MSRYGGKNWGIVMKAVKLVALALFLAPASSFAIVVSACGDGLFRNAGDACPAGSSQTHNVPANWNRPLNPKAEKTAGPGGACTCPENWDKVSHDDGAGWHCVQGIPESGSNEVYTMQSGAFRSQACTVAPVPVAASTDKPKEKEVPKVKEVTLALAVDAEFKNEADCKETIQTALRVTHRLIPAGAKEPVTGANAKAYCKSLFPTENSPMVKVTMASSFTVSSLEECTTRLNTAKGYAVSVKQVVGNKLEEVEEARPLCEAKFLAANDDGTQDLLDRIAMQAALDAEAHGQTIKVGDSGPDRAPASESK